MNRYITVKRRRKLHPTTTSHTETQQKCISRILVLYFQEHLNRGKKKERPCRSFRISEGFVSLAYCYDCSENLHIPLHGCREQVCHCVHMQLIYSFLLRSTRRNSYVFLTLLQDAHRVNKGQSLIGVFAWFLDRNDEKTPEKNCNTFIKS